MGIGLFCTYFANKFTCSFKEVSDLLQILENLEDIDLSAVTLSAVAAAAAAGAGYHMAPLPLVIPLPLDQLLCQEEEEGA